MDNLFYLFLAYSVIWILIFMYSLRIGRRQGALQKELELLKQVISNKTM